GWVYFQASNGNLSRIKVRDCEFSGGGDIDPDDGNVNARMIYIVETDNGYADDIEILHNWMDASEVKGGFMYIRSAVSAGVGGRIKIIGNTILNTAITNSSKNSYAVALYNPGF